MARGSKKQQPATRKKTSTAKKALKRAASSVKGAASRVKSGATSTVSRVKKKITKKKTAGGATATTVGRARTAPKKAARVTRRESDIGIDRIEATYTPQTSMKAGFRADGSDRQRDQEFAGGMSDERFKDEDRFTNKSGDPRIGTHGRTYEPGEKKRKKVDYETE